MSASPPWRGWTTVNIDRILADLRKQRDGISKVIAALEKSSDDIVEHTERKSVGRKALSGEIVTAQRLLTDLFGNATIGLAVVDDQLRYQALNPCLAAMDGISAESHFGKDSKGSAGRSCFAGGACGQAGFDHGAVYFEL